jgi:hypothetical protein
MAKVTSSTLLIKTPDQNPADIQDDEYRGVGGSYIIDLATGKRKRVQGPGMEQPVGADNIRPTGQQAGDDTLTAAETITDES